MSLADLHTYMMSRPAGSGAPVDEVVRVISSRAIAQVEPEPVVAPIAATPRRESAGEPIGEVERRVDGWSTATIPGYPVLGTAVPAVVHSVAMPRPGAPAGPRSLADAAWCLFQCWDPFRHCVDHEELARFAPGFERCEAEPGEIVRAGIGTETLAASHYGYLVRPEWVGDGASWVDKVRQYDGILPRLGVLSGCNTLEVHVPSFNESSRANGARWGGLASTPAGHQFMANWYGRDEMASLSAQSVLDTAGAADVVFVLNRVIIYAQPVSRDLAADSQAFRSWFDYAAYQEIRYALESAILTGPGGATPMGAINDVATQTIAKDSGQTSGTVSTTNIDQMWSRLYGPCRRNAIWLASDDTVYQVDQAATSGGWPRSFYSPSGETQLGIPIIKGRPLISSECLPVVGTPGDLTLIDPTQWFGFYRTVKKGNQPELEMSLVMPGDMIERSESEHFLFDSDSIALRFKCRFDSHSIWTSGLTIFDGAINVGPCCIIAQR